MIKLNYIIKVFILFNGLNGFVSSNKIEQQEIEEKKKSNNIWFYIGGGFIICIVSGIVGFLGFQKYKKDKKAQLIKEKQNSQTHLMP